nr:Toll/interleukin-1 receptor (TIR) domain-containing protein [Tanacetum cinerariifolium]
MPCGATTLTKHVVEVSGGALLWRRGVLLLMLTKKGWLVDLKNREVVMKHVVVEMDLKGPVANYLWFEHKDYLVIFVVEEVLEPNSTEIGNRGKNVVATIIQDDVEGINIIDVEVFEVLDSIDVKVLPKKQKLDKGKGKMSEADIFKSKKGKPLQRGNGITIKENEKPLPTNTDSFDSEDHTQSESQSDCSEKSK